MIAAFGWEVLPWLLLQAATGITFLEAANYREHYGLLRARRTDGGFVKACPEDHLVSNLFLCQLLRHSDHHANPRLRYQSLRTAPTAPQLPAGYAVMIVCAAIPPLWPEWGYRVLDCYENNFDLVHNKARPL